MSSPSPEGLGLTPHRQIAASELAGMVVGYFLVGTMQWRGMTVPVTPWSLPLMLAALAAAGVVYARVLAAQVARNRASVSAHTAVLALVLGKTMLMTGAIVAGGHLVYVLANVGRWSVPMPRERVVHGTVTIVAAALFALSGRLLEKACIVPGHGDEKPSQGSEQP